MASPQFTPTVILLRETWWRSLVKDAGSFAMVAGLAGVGVLLDSTALQWIGAIMGFLWVMARGSEAMRKAKCTIPEARTKLDELEEGQ